MNVFLTQCPRNESAAFLSAVCCVTTHPYMVRRQLVTDGERDSGAANHEPECFRVQRCDWTERWIICMYRYARW